MKINDYGLTEFDDLDLGRKLLYGVEKQIKYCSCVYCTHCIKRQTEFVQGTITWVSGNYVDLLLDKEIEINGKKS